MNINASPAPQPNLHIPQPSSPPSWSLLVPCPGILFPAGKPLAARRNFYSTSWLIGLLAAGSLLFPGIAGAAPVNDSFTAATALTGALPILQSGTLQDATRQPGEPRLSEATATVWYQWTVPSTGFYSITLPEAHYTGELDALTGSSLQDLILLATTRDALHSRFHATAGTVIHLRVEGSPGVGESESAAFQLRLDAVPAPQPPPNDLAANATFLPATLPASISGTTQDATLETREPRHLPVYDSDFADSGSVWHRWTSPAAGWYTFSMEGTAGSITAYTGSSLTNFIQAAPRGDNNGNLKIFSTSGTTYYLQIIAANFSAGPYTLTVNSNSNPVPANDTFATRANLGNALPASASGDLTHATIESGERLPANMRATVWYQWTAPAPGVYLAEATGNDFLLAAYRGTTLGNVQLLTHSGDFAPLYLLAETAGATFNLQLGGFRWDPDDLGPYTFSITAADPAAYTGRLGKLLSVNATPASVDLSSSAQTITLDVLTTEDPTTWNISVESPASLTAFRPGNYAYEELTRKLQSIRQSLTPGTEGPLTSGVPTRHWTTTFTLPPGLPPGQYPLLFSAYGPDGLVQWGGSLPENVALDVPGTSFLTIQNTGPQDQLPTLTSFSLSSSTVDVTSGAATLELAAIAADDSRVAEVFVTFHNNRSNANEKLLPYDLRTFPLTRTAGSDTNGTWTASIPISTWTTPGEFFPTITVIDGIAGESTSRLGRDYGYFNPAGTPLPAGSPASFTIINNKRPDITPPQVLAVEFTPATLSLQGGPQTVTARLHVRETQSGTGSYLGFYNPEYVNVINGFSTDEGESVYLQITNATTPVLTSGTMADGWHEIILTVDPTGLSTGSYQPFFHIADAAGRIFGADYSTAAAGFTLGSLQITSGPGTAPTFTQHPTSQTVTAGQTATFSVSVTGSPTPVLQWWHRAQPAAPWQTVGTNSNTLTIPNAQSANAGEYHATASNGITPNTISSFATLTVQPLIPAPQITQQPAPAIVVFAGSRHTLSATATGSDLTWQWYSGPVGDTSTPIAGATSNTFSISPVQAGSYWVRVSNPGGFTNSTATVITSNANPAGASWGNASSPVTTHLWAVEWLGLQFIAVGDSGVILTSPDGITWTQRASGTTQQLEGLTWNGSLYIAVGANGTILSSTDGITWTVRRSGGGFEFNSIAWDGNAFHALGTANIHYTSTNGITWQTAPATSLESYHLRWLHGTACAVGPSNVRTSTDFSTWTTRLNTAGMFYDDVASNGSTWAVIGSDSKVRLSTNLGQTWTAGQTISNTWLRGIASNGLGFVIVGNAGVIYTSPQGTTWTQRNSSATGILHAVASNGSRYVAVGENGKIILSDGAWQGASLTNFSQWAVSRGLTGGAATPTGDWDQDGTPNILEFLTGTHPSLPTDRWSPLPEPYQDPTGPRIRLIIPRSLQSAALTLTAETSPDNQTWSPLPLTPTPDGTGFTTRHQWTAPLTPTNRKAFFRYRYPTAP